MRCESAVRGGEPLLSVIPATFTAHLVLNNLHQALKLLRFPFRVLKVREKKRTFGKSNKGNVWDAKHGRLIKQRRR